MNMKLIITGHGQHGKDTVCELLHDYFGMKFQSSSLFAAEKVVYPVLKEKYNYESLWECYNDRHAHRQEWFDLITQYNTPDLARLGTEIFADNDIYCGLRNRDELYALLLAFPEAIVIWVDASMRKPPEDITSCTITANDSNVIIDNNGTLLELRRQVLNMMTAIQRNLIR